MQIALRGVAEACLDRGSVEIDRIGTVTVEDIFRDLSDMDERIERAFIDAETNEVRSYARILVDGKVAKLTDKVTEESAVTVCIVSPCDG